MENIILFIGTIGTAELLIIGAAILLLFGGKKIPELMKGLGKGIKNFKDGVQGIDDDISDAQSSKEAEKKDK